MKVLAILFLTVFTFFSLRELLFKKKYFRKLKKHKTNYLKYKYSSFEKIAIFGVLLSLAYLSVFLIKISYKPFIIKTLGKEHVLEISEITHEKNILSKGSYKERHMDVYHFWVKKNHHKYSYYQSINVRDSSLVKLHYKLGDKKNIYYHKNYGFCENENSYVYIVFFIGSIFFIMLLPLFIKGLLQ